MTTTATKYCPQCKESREMLNITKQIWGCKECEFTFEDTAIKQAFLDISKQGALKFDTDKPQMELLDPYAMEQIASVMTFGARKYAAHNWRKGFKFSRLIGAALRHLSAYTRGEDKDPESGLSHLAHLGCCVMFLLWHDRFKPELDDRYKEGV